MATRIYLPSAAVAEVTPAYSSAWEKVSSADRIRAVTAKSDTPLVERSYTPSSVATADTLIRQYVSDPLNAGSISGTVKGVLQARRWTAYGTFKNQMTIRVVSRDGLTVRGTLLATVAGGRGSNISSMQNRYLAPAATALSTVVAQQGDRIVIEVGTHTIAGYWLIGIFQKFGDPTATADLIENETQTTVGDPWIEFSANLGFEPAGGPPPPVYAAPVGGPMTTPRELVDWELYLCDKQGVALADITEIARNTDLGYVFKRATIGAFEVPSDHAKIKTIHSDGFPLLAAKKRTIKGWRWEGSERVLRFAANVVTTDDIAEADSPTTKVVCADPLEYAESRWAVDSAGLPFDVVFAGDEGAQIVRILIDRANQYGQTGIGTGTFEVTTARTVTFDQKKMAAAIIELADADDGFDFYLGPVDRTDGVLVSMNCYQIFGADRPDVIFAWDTPPNSARGTSRIEDGSQLANVLIGRGANGLTTAIREDAASIAAYGRHEDTVTYLEIEDLAYLTAQVDAELAARKSLREKVTMKPAPGRAPEPFSHFFLGDTVRTRASDDLRGGFTRSDRVYGFTINLDQGEKLTSVTLAAGT